MKDREFIELRNRFFLAILISLIVIVPVLLLFINKFTRVDSSILKRIKNNETFFLVIEEKQSKKIKQLLKSNKVSFEVINKKKLNDYEDILEQLEIEEDDITLPTVFYIKEGELIASLSNVTEEDLEEFIINYKE